MSCAAHEAGSIAWDAEALSVVVCDGSAFQAIYEPPPCDAVESEGSTTWCVIGHDHGVASRLGDRKTHGRLTR